MSVLFPSVPLSFCPSFSFPYNPSTSSPNHPHPFSYSALLHPHIHLSCILNTVLGFFTESRLGRESWVRGARRLYSLALFGSEPSVGRWRRVGRTSLQSLSFESGCMRSSSHFRVDTARWRDFGVDIVMCILDTIAHLERVGCC